MNKHVNVVHIDTVELGESDDPAVNKLHPTPVHAVHWGRTDWYYPAPQRQSPAGDTAMAAITGVTTVSTTEFGFNIYEADPGEELPLGYHYHPNHQELFYVIEGALAFENP